VAGKRGADLSTELVYLNLAGAIEAEVEAVILIFTLLLALDLLLTSSSHIRALHLCLKTLDSLAVNSQDILTECLELFLASLLQGILKVETLAHADLHIKQCGTAFKR
jgi:hypothetical protein